MSKICGIYKITSPTNRIYIGQSVDISSRFSKYKSLNCREQPKLYRSLAKHGPENHFFEVIHTCEPSELNSLEVYYIEIFNSFNSINGLNLHTGGNNHKISDETRMKLSIALRGRKLKPRTEEHSRKIGLAAKTRCNTPEYKKISSERNKGKPAWNIGVKHKEETRRKISEKRSRKTKTESGEVVYQCTGCNVFYSSNNFYVSKRSPTLLTAKCKPCERKASQLRKKKYLINELNKPAKNE